MSRFQKLKPCLPDGLRFAQVYVLILTFAFGTNFEQLVKSFSSVKSDLGKVLKGAMSAHPDFATKTTEKAISFILIFNSGNSSKIKQAISDLLTHQVFREVLWGSVMHPVDGLTDGKSNGRIGDLYPEEVLSRSNWLAQRLVGNLMTFASFSFFHSLY